MKKPLLGTLTAALLLFAAYTSAQNACVPCYYDSRILAGHGQTEDGRRILNVYVEPRGWDSGTIRGRMEAAAACASSRWNNTGGSNASTRIPYSLQVTTDQSQADIVIQRGLSASGCAGNTQSGNRDMIDMDSATQNLGNEDLCLVVSHELGDSLGLDNEESCISIMAGVRGDGTCRPGPELFAIQPNDVDRVNQHFSSQSTCTSSTTGSQTLPHCPDLNRDGLCDGGGSVCEEWQRQSCYWLYEYSWNESTCTCECLNVYNCGDTPVVLDTLGNGFSLTGAREGVNFDLNADGARTTLRPSVDVEYVLSKDGKEVGRQAEDWRGLSDSGQRLTLARLIPTDRLPAGNYKIAIHIRDRVSGQSLSPAADFRISETK